MSRLLLLLPLLLWMGRPLGLQADGWILRAQAPLLFLGLFAALVGSMGLWSRVLARRVIDANLHRSLRRYNRMMFAARLLIPAWFAFGLYGLGWGQLVTRFLGPLGDGPLELPALLVGTLPALLAWMGLWWSQYPAERALREQSMLMSLEADLPVHSVPNFRHYFTTQLRLQVLFSLAPVLLILLARDVIALILQLLHVHQRTQPAVEMSISLLAAAAVLLFSPLLLRRVLDTHPLADSPLRRRLEAMAARHGVRFSDILLWRTNHHMGNAAVMGMLPTCRYVLLSDLLLETMTDEQIEAVFAHELGHLVQRHLLWMGLGIVALTFVLMGPGEWLNQQIDRWHMPAWLPVELLMLIGGIGLFVVGFGLISRRFERQADWFAALQLQAAGEPTPGGGAERFAAALHRVALVNNIPIAANEWLHGSIGSRLNGVRILAGNPDSATRFGRSALRLRMILLLMLLISAAWTAMMIR